MPNTLDSELGPPQRDAVIAGNYVHDNGNPDAPTKALTYPAFGMGIAVTGGRDNLIAENVVEDSATYGVVVMPIVDTNLWVTRTTSSGTTSCDAAARPTSRSGAPPKEATASRATTRRQASRPAIERLFPCSGVRPFPGGRRLDGANDRPP